MLLPPAASPPAAPDLLPVFNALPGANLLLSPDWVIMGASDDYLAATLTQRATLVGQFIFDAFPDNPQAPEAQAVASVRAALTAVLATRQPHTMAPQHYDVPDPAQPGQFVERHWLPVHTPVLDAAGQVQFIIQSVQDVTASHLAERRLHESQAREQLARADAEAQRQRLYEFMSAAPGIVLSMVGPQHIIEFANEGFRQQFGMPDPVGKPYLEALPGAMAQYAPEYEATALYDHIYRTGEPYYAAEAPYYVDATPGGQRELRYFAFAVQAARDGTGRITGVQAYATDVTTQVVARQRVEELNQELEARVRKRTRQLEKKQAEALAAAERRAQEREELYQVLAQTPAAIAITRGPDHRYVYANPASQALFVGRQLVGYSVAEALPEASSQGLLALLDRVYATGETYSGTELPLAFAGPAGGPAEVRYFNFTYQAYREKGQVVGISTFAYNVTEQVRARQEREMQRRRLHEVFEQAPIAICVLAGPAYVLEVVNPPMAEMLGHPVQQLVGRPFFEALPELAQQGLPELLAQVRQTGTPCVAQEQKLHLARHGAGGNGFYTFTYQPLRDAQGLVTAVTCMAHEVTEQVRARQLVEQSQQQVHDLNARLAAINEQLQATNAELGESNTRLTRTNVDLDTFVYTASHDLKAPITNIEGILAALREVLPAAVQQDKMVARLLGLLANTVSRFLTTIADLTDLSRLQQSYNEPAELVALAPLVAGVVEDLGPAIAAAGAELHLEVPAGLHVSFAPASLRSIVYNLLSNAVKYRDAARPAHVWLRAANQANTIVLTVRDNGLGLTPGQQQRLFGVFQRMHTHVEGTGVGLYMIKRLIDNADAHITVSSEPGIGSTFTVAFAV